MELCLHCHIGRIELRRVVFVQQQNRTSAVIDRLPALVCGTCGQKTYDTRALENLQRLLLSPERQKQPSHPARPGSR